MIILNSLAKSRQATWGILSRNNTSVSYFSFGASMSGAKLHVCVGNVGDDCPVFDGLFDYCAISAGGSMG
jgi:hypothetical protein